MSQFNWKTSLVRTQWGRSACMDPASSGNWRTCVQMTFYLLVPKDAQGTTSRNTTYCFEEWFNVITFHQLLCWVEVINWYNSMYPPPEVFQQTNQNQQNCIFMASCMCVCPCKTVKINFKSNISMSDRLSIYFMSYCKSSVAFFKQQNCIWHLTKPCVLSWDLAVFSTYF